MSVLPVPARSVAELNAAIRALWQGAGGVLTDGQRREYERLLVEWAAAVRAERAEVEVPEAA